jgi:MFS family permease
LIPIIYFTYSLTSPIGGTIENKLGGRKSIVLSYFILCISFSLMYFSKNIYIDYIIMFFIGIGLSAGISITKKNACSFFLVHKSFISGVIYLIPGFLCFFLNIINEKHILNPLSQSPTIDNLYYDKKIFLNFQKLIIFEIGVLIVTCFLTLILYFQNVPKETNKFGFNGNQKNINEKNISKAEQIKKAKYSKRAFRQFMMLFLFFPTINFINNTWRPIGIYYKIDTYYLQLTTALYSLTGCIASIIFSLIGDRISFKFTFVFFAFCLTIISFCYPLSFKNDIFYICEVLITIFILRGYNIIIDPHIMKVYGIKNYIEIGGFVKASGGISEILCIIFVFYLENNFSGDKDFIYKFMYIISGIFNLISLILGVFEGDDEYNYKN